MSAAPVRRPALQLREAAARVLLDDAAAWLRQAKRCDLYTSGGLARHREPADAVELLMRAAGTLRSGPNAPNVPPAPSLTGQTRTLR